MKRKDKSILKRLIFLILMIALFLFVMFFLVMGIYSIYHGIELSHVADKSLSWPETGGVITDSYIHVYEHTDDDGTKTWYETVIRYAYRLNEKTYSGNSITLLSCGPHTTDRAEVETFISDYPEGLSVIVYYDPENPQTAVLVKEKVGSINGFTAFGCFLIIIWICGVIGLVGAFRDKD